MSRTIEVKDGQMSKFIEMAGKKKQKCIMVQMQILSSILGES